MAVDRWHPERVTRAVNRVLAQRMRASMLILQGAVQRKISVGQPVRRTSGGHLVGEDPSAPGDPPKVVSSRLRTSIASDVTVGPLEVVGKVGSNVPYARRLELGFSATDALGRNINQAERPYLRPALKENLPRLIRRLMAR